MSELTERDKEVMWLEMRIASLKSQLARQAMIEKTERELRASVAGDGNEYMIVWTYPDKAILVMTKQGKKPDA